jgi:hypothetical protein
VLAWQLLERTPRFWPGVGLAALALAVAAAILFVAAAIADERRARAIGRIALTGGLVAMLVGPGLYSAETAGRAITGGDPSPGPVTGFGADGFAGDGAGTTDALVAWLVAHRGGATWLVAVSSANQAGPLQLASGVPVMAMGGFMGTDPAPTLAQLQAEVRDGRLRYVLLGGPGGGPGGFFGGDGRGAVASARTRWVTEACRAVDDVAPSLYDCGGAA